MCIRDSIQRMLGFTGVSEADAKPRAEAILALETALAKPQWDRVKLRDRDKTYNVVTFAQLQQQYQMCIRDRYLAGQIPETADAAIEVQTAEVLAAIDALLAQAGSDKSRILRAQIFLADINDFAGMNRAWDAWVVAGNAPDRATVEATLANPAWKVEIVVTAVV